MDQGILESQVRQYVRDALLACPYIREVDGFSFSKKGSRVEARFTVHTVYEEFYPENGGFDQMTKEEMLRLLTAATGPAAAPRAPLPETCSVPAPMEWRSFGAWRSTDWNGGPLCPPLWGSGSPPCAPTGGCVRKEGDGRGTACPDAGGAGRNPAFRQRADHYAAWCGQAADILRVKVLLWQRKQHRGHRGGGPGGKAPGAGRHPGGPGRRGQGAARGRGRGVMPPLRRR